MFDGDQLLEKNSEQIPINNVTIEDLEQNTLNIIFYEDSFAKTRFFTNTISEWNTPISYLDFDLLYSGYIKSGITSAVKNITLLCPHNDLFCPIELTYFQFVFVDHIPLLKLSL